MTPIPGPDAVVIWTACFADIDEPLAEWLACLDDREMAIVMRMRQPRQAIAYAGRHAMCRAVLGAMIGQQARALHFEIGGFGKPALSTNGRPPFFSLSHTGETAVVAVRADAEVGVDIEDTTSTDLSAARLFTPAEQAMLAALGPAERQAAFYRLWVCREAALKAAATGLSIPPDKVELAWVREAADRCRATIIAGTQPSYVVQLFRLPRWTVGAIATDRSVGVSLHWWRRCQWRAACSACATSLMA